MPTVTVKIKLPDYNRKAFTDLLIAGKELVPFHNYALLIDHQFFYSHESDVEELLNERLDQEWRKRKYESAVYQEEYWKEYFLEEEKRDKVPRGFDANTFFKYRVKLEMRHARIIANAEIADCWIRILKHYPEYIDRCPWRFFQGKRLWQTLQDDELLNAIKQTPLQVAEKMNFNVMTAPDWEKVLKIVPEVAGCRQGNNYDCFVE